MDSVDLEKRYRVMGNEYQYGQEESYDFLEEVVFRLEESWRTRGEADLVEFVVEPGHPLRERALIELIKVDQEYRWESGKRKPLEDYLREWPELRGKRETLAELLTAECETRAYLNEETNRDDLSARFPEIADQIDWKTVRGDSEESAAPEFRVRCPHCHRPVLLRGDETLREVACPCCQSRFSVLSDESSAVEEGADSRISRHVGQYELLQRVGKGSFGTVWKARDTRLDCIVAIKIPRFGQLHAEDAERFLKEAQAAAQLQHPNIVHVREVELDEETSYIASDFIEGTPLDEVLAEQRFGPREAAQLCAKIAGALHYAHERGVVHRDLKPSNVMIDASGEPHLMDFGLAKREAGEVTMTLDGQIIGTPAYMSPEQAKGGGHRADRRCDVYSLGVLLYEMLTGEQPFRGNIRMLLKQVAEDAPPPPRKLDSHIPRDLETICLKCMEKLPEQRFPTAEAVAEELRRFLQGVPITARPIGAPSRAWRWCRRRPLVAGLAGAFLLASISGTIVSSLFAVEAFRQADAAENIAADLREQKEVSDSLAKAESAARDRAERQRERAETQRRRAEQQTKEVREAKEAAERLLYANQIALAQRDWRAGELAGAWNNLNACRWDFRGWEHDYLFTAMSSGFRRFTGHTDRLRGVAFSPDGKRIVSVGWDKTIKVWDAETGEVRRTIRGHDEEITSVAFGPEGRRIVTGSYDGTVRIWDVETGEECCRCEGHGNKVLGVDFGPKGNRVASASIDRTLCIWDAHTGKRILSCSAEGAGFRAVSFSPDGRRIAGVIEGAVKVFDAQDGSEASSIKELPHRLHCLDFSPDGKRIITGDAEGSVRILDVETGQMLIEGKGHRDPVYAVAFCPDGSRAVSGGMDKTVRIWDTATGRETCKLVGHEDMIFCVAVSSDGRRIASGAKDNVLGVWEDWNESGDRTLVGHPWGVVDVVVSPDGRRLAATSNAGTIELWDISSGKKTRVLDDGPHNVNTVAFTPDGQSIVSGGITPGVRIWNAESGEHIGTIEAPREVISLDFMPDGSRLAIGCRKGKAGVWDFATKERLLCIDKDKKACIVVAFDPSGMLVCSGLRSEPLEVWDVDKQVKVLETKGRHAFPVMALDCSLDGRWILSGSYDNTAKVWDAKTGEEVHTLSGHSGNVGGVAFSPDGGRIATSSADGTIKLWNTKTGRETLTLRGHVDNVNGVVFSPDGRRLFSSSSDGTVRIWNASARQETRTLAQHAAELTTIAFSSDGKWIATGSKDDSIVLWDARTGRAVRTLKGHRDGISKVAFSPDCLSIAAGSADGTIKVWNVEDGQERFALGDGRERHGVLDVAYSPDGKRIAGVLDAGIVILWDPASRKPRCTLAARNGKVLCVAFDPKGRTFAVGASDGTITIWDCGFNAEERRLSAGDAPISCIAYGPEGRHIVAASENGSVSIWDLDSGESLHTMKGQQGRVSAVAYSPDGGRIVSGAADCSVGLWNTETGKLIRRLRGHTGAVNSVAFGPDGRYVASGSDDGTGKIWKAEEIADSAETAVEEQEPPVDTAKSSEEK